MKFKYKPLGNITSLFRGARFIKLLVIFIVSCALFISSGKTLRASSNLTVNVNQVLSDVSNHPVGLNVSFLADTPEMTSPLADIQAKTLRFTTNEYYLFNHNDPLNPKVSIQDPELWQVKSFAKSDGTWYSKLNFDDFIATCQSIGAEPFVVVPIDAIVYSGNAPHATPEEVLQGAVEWVRYANITNKYNVKYWEIGNESNLQTHSKIYWTPEKYAETVVKFSQAMKAVDPSIKIGANGMRVTNSKDWWDQIMPTIKNNVDFLITHQYSWLDNYENWKNDIYEYDYNIKDANKAINDYNPTLRLNVTENSSFNPGVHHENNIWKMLHNFEIIGQTLCFETVDYVHFWTSRWLEKDSYQEDFSSFDCNYQKTPMGYPLKVWGLYLKKKMVYASKSDPIRSWATYDPDDKSLNLLILNKDRNTQHVTVTLDNYDNPNLHRAWTLLGNDPESKKVIISKYGGVKVQNSQVNAGLKPLSITIIALKNSIFAD
ncbi:MAG: hypothetical protein ACFCU5_04065 [Pleurocapsa sp.]